MPQEDYLKRQVDQFAKALAKLLAKLTELKGAGSSDKVDGDQIVNEVLGKEANLSVKGLLDIPVDNFISVLLHQNKMSVEQLELLANILYILSESHEHEKELLWRTRTILEHIHSSNDIYSLERHFRIQQITKKINLQ